MVNFNQWILSGRLIVQIHDTVINILEEQVALLKTILNSDLQVSSESLNLRSDTSTVRKFMWLSEKDMTKETFPQKFSLQ